MSNKLTLARQGGNPIDDGFKLVPGPQSKTRMGVGVNLILSSAPACKGDRIVFGNIGRLRLRISDALMSNCGWLVGDRINVLFQHEYRLGCIRKSACGGYLLSGNPKLRGKTGEAYFTFKFATEVSMPLVESPIEIAVKHFDKEEIVFSIPADIAWTPEM